MVEMIGHVLINWIVRKGSKRHFIGSSSLRVVIRETIAIFVVIQLLNLIFVRGIILRDQVTQ